MPRVRLKFDPTATGDWLAELSTAFPDAEFVLLASHPADDGLLGILEIRAPDPDAIVSRFETAPEVRDFEVMHADEGTALLRTVTPIPEGYRANRASGTPPAFPARMRDGWIHTELTGPHERLSAFVDELAAAGVPYEVQSLTQSHDPFELLTDRQREFVREAVERGYYENPRDCTLTDLAETFDVNKSAASGILRRAERAIVETYVDASIE